MNHLPLSPPAGSRRAELALRVRLIMFSGADHALASLRESNLTLAIISHASALAIVASKSFARRRLRLSQAMVRSTTQRRGNNLKPLAASDRLTISMVQRPIEASAFLSFGPA